MHARVFRFGKRAALVFIAVTAVHFQAHAAALISIASSTPTAFIGQQVTFSIQAPAAVVVGFGDGSSANVPAGSSIISHTYAAVGTYIATVSSSITSPILASLIIRIVAAIHVVPSGDIISVTPSIAPALAGADVHFVTIYSLALPTFAASPRLEAVIDLLDNKRHLIRRSDPFALPPGSAGINAVNIPYSIPVDAIGEYAVRVLIRSVTGGTVAVSPRQPFIILSPADPTPNVRGEVQANGSLEVGPRTTSTGALNAGFGFGLVWPTETVSLTGLFDPISHHSDALLAYRTGAPSKSLAPDAPGATPGPGLNAAIGRTQVQFPQILGGVNPIRGIDVSDQSGPFTYHFADGYTRLNSEGEGSESAALFDISRTVSSTGTMQFAVLTHSDTTNNTGNGVFSPMSSGAMLLSVERPLQQYWSIDAAGLLTESRSTSVNSRVSTDAADEVGLTYAHQIVTGNIEYNNGGPDIFLGPAAGAVSDHVAFQSNLAFATSPVSQLQFGYSEDASRSILSKNAVAFTTLALSPANFPSVTVTLRRVAELALDSATTTNQMSFTLSKNAQLWSINLSGAFAGVKGDRGAPNSTTQEVVLQVARQQNSHTFSAGFTGSRIDGSAVSSMTGATISYGFPFDTKANGRGFEFLAEGDATNATSLISGASDVGITYALSYHFGPSFVVGLRDEANHHFDRHPSNNSLRSALRLRIDMQI